MELHNKIIDDLQKEFEQNSNVLAMFVTGSVARGEAVDGNDLDVHLVTNGEEISKQYRVGNTLVELSTLTIPEALERIQENPMFVYMYLDAKAVFDKGSHLEIFQNKAKDVLQSYKPMQEEKKAVKKWLSSVVDKIAAAKKSEDAMKISFCISCNLWKTVEGMYMINSVPVPAFTSALRRLKTLKILPQDFEAKWQKILLGSLDDRTDETIELIKFVLKKLD